MNYITIYIYMYNSRKGDIYIVESIHVDEDEANRDFPVANDGGVVLPEAK